MLWLPKWLASDEAPAEGVSRRTFLFLGAAAGVGALLPAPGVAGDAFADGFGGLLHGLDNRTFVVPVHVGRNFVASANLPGWLGFANLASTRLASVSCVPPGDTRANYYNVRVNAAELAAIQRDGWRSPVLAERLQTEYGLVRR